MSCFDEGNALHFLFMSPEKGNPLFQSFDAIHNSDTGIARTTHPTTKCSSLVTVIEAKPLGGFPQHAQQREGAATVRSFMVRMMVESSIAVTKGPKYDATAGSPAETKTERPRSRAYHRDRISTLPCLPS